MKRFLCLLLVFCIAAPLCGIPECHAAETETIVRQTIEDLPDGTSILITVLEIPVMPRAAAYQKSGSKIYACRNEDGDLLWQFTLSATFSVQTGTNAKCIGSSYSYKIIDSRWKYVTGNSYYSSNKAFGNGTFDLAPLGITLETRKCQVTLACDANGNLS